MEKYLTKEFVGWLTNKDIEELYNSFKGGKKVVDFPIKQHYSFPGREKIEELKDFDSDLPFYPITPSQFKVEYPKEDKIKEYLQRTEYGSFTNRILLKLSEHFRFVGNENMAFDVHLKSLVNLYIKSILPSLEFIMSVLNEHDFQLYDTRSQRGFFIPPQIKAKILFSYLKEYEANMSETFAFKTIKDLSNSIADGSFLNKDYRIYKFTKDEVVSIIKNKDYKEIDGTDYLVEITNGSHKGDVFSVEYILGKVESDDDMLKNVKKQHSAFKTFQERHCVEISTKGAPTKSASKDIRFIYQTLLDYQKELSNQSENENYTYKIVFDIADILGIVEEWKAKQRKKGGCCYDCHLEDKCSTCPLYKQKKNDYIRNTINNHKI